MSAATALRWFAADALVLTGRGLRHHVRHLDGLLLGVLLPVFMLLLFVYVFGGALETGRAYVDYVVPGIIVLTAGYGAAQTAVSVAEDLSTGTIDRFRSLPMSPAALLTGHVLAALVRNLGSTLLVVLVAVGIGFRPTTSVLAWLGVLAVTGVYVLAMAWLAVVVGVAAGSTESASGFTFFVLFLPYVSSAFVPPETLPAVLRGFAEHQPFTPVIETMRGLLLGTPVAGSVGPALAWCLGVLALAVGGSALLFRRRTRR